LEIFLPSQCFIDNNYLDIGKGNKLEQKCFENFQLYIQKNPEKGKEATTPSNIKEIQEVQGGQEAPHNGSAIIPKDG
jgi:hypothetical protein